MSQQLPKAEFTDVDRATDSQGLTRLLDNQHANTFHQMYKQRTFALLDIGTGQSVLDVGCGTGVDVLEMAKRVGANGHVVGIDFSQTMIDEATQRSQSTDLTVSFYQADGRKLLFEDNSFDCCRSDRTFQHLPEPRLVLTEMRKCRSLSLNALSE